MFLKRAVPATPRFNSRSERAPNRRYSPFGPTDRPLAGVSPSSPARRWRRRRGRGPPARRRSPHTPQPAATDRSVRCGRRHCRARDCFVAFQNLVHGISQHRMRRQGRSRSRPPLFHPVGETRRLPREATPRKAVMCMWGRASAPQVARSAPTQAPLPLCPVSTQARAALQRPSCGTPRTGDCRPCEPR